LLFRFWTYYQAHHQDQRRAAALGLFLYLFKDSLERLSSMKQIEDSKADAAVSCLYPTPSIFVVLPTNNKTVCLSCVIACCSAGHHIHNDYQCLLLHQPQGWAALLDDVRAANQGFQHNNKLACHCLFPQHQTPHKMILFACCCTNRRAGPR
jgi:hypothetical protein